MLATTDSTPSCLSGGTTRNNCEKDGFTGDLVCRADTGSFDALEAHYLITWVLKSCSNDFQPNSTFFVQVCSWGDSSKKPCGGASCSTTQWVPATCRCSSALHHWPAETARAEGEQERRLWHCCRNEVGRAVLRREARLLRSSYGSSEPDRGSFCKTQENDKYSFAGVETLCRNDCLRTERKAASSGRATARKNYFLLLICSFF